MATKVIKEIITDVGGNTTIEYSDDTTQKYNVADVVTAQSNPVTGGIIFSAGDASFGQGVSVYPSGTASSNAVEIQAALDRGGVVTIAGTPGDVFDVSETLLVGSNTTVILSDGITIRKTGTTTTQVFSNKNKETGNENITIIGFATIDGNFAEVSGLVANIRNWNTINMVNVDNLVVRGSGNKRLKIKGAYKYNLFAAKVTNFTFSDIQLYSYGVNPAPGRDGIHLGGNSRYGIIERIYGQTNDDFIAINPAALPLGPNETYPNGMGPISDVVIRDIYGKVVDRSGAVLHLYGAAYSDEAQTVIDGFPDAANASGHTRPAIVAISTAGGIATATTDKPHLMNIGDPFKIATANPAGYNTYPGFVLSVPSGDSFTYSVSSSTGVYVSGAVLTSYWQLDRIIIENVRGETVQGAILGMDQWSVAPGAGAVMRGIQARGISGRATNPTSGTLIGQGSVLLIDSSFTGLQNPRSDTYLTWTGTTTAGRDACGTRGLVTISAANSDTPFFVNNTSGYGILEFPSGVYRGLFIDGFLFQDASASGSWRHGIRLYLQAGSDVTLRNCSIQSASLARGYIAAVTAMSTGSVVRMDNCKTVGASEGLIDVKDGAGVTGGRIIVSGGVVESGSASSINVYGNGIDVVMCNGFENQSSNPPVRFLGTAANGSATADETVKNAASSIANLGGTGPYVIKGLGSKIDIGHAKCSRVDGAIVYNTNAARGTLGTAGLVVGQGTSSDSWRLLGDPALRY